MTSDARERLRRALDVGHDLSRGRTLELVMAAEALLAEPHAPAHADHDALAELLDRLRKLYWLPADGFLHWRCDDVEYHIKQLQDRPRAVPDAGALQLAQLRRWAASLVPGNIEAQIVVDEIDGILERLWGRRAPQPQPGACGVRHPHGHYACTLGFRHEGEHRDVANDLCWPDARQPQPAPEEPMRESTEQEWLDAHGEHRREQAQASEAAKRWRERVCLWTNTGGKSDPLTLGELLDEAVEHWDAGVGRIEELNRRLEETEDALGESDGAVDALRKENEELREEIEDANRVLIQQDNGLIDDGLSHGGLVRTVVTRLDDKLNEAECDRDALRKENEELRAKLEAIKKAL